MCVTFVMRVEAAGGERRKTLEKLGRREREEQKK